MTAEIIAVGTELLLGGTANLDAQIISEKLSELGINVYYHTVVGDNAERVKSAIEIAKSRADILITTGGLGPTYDDMTKQAVAESFGKKLVRFPEEETRVRAWFSAVGFAFTDNNLSQADFPENCTILANSCGTAPGCAFECNGKHILMLPGPPRECKAMLESGVVPYLKSLSPNREILSHTLHIFGLGESAVEAKLRDYMVGLTNPTLAPYAKLGEVHLRVTASAETREIADAMTQPVIEKVKAVLGGLVYGVDCVSLENRASQLLRASKMTLSCAESCTGGLIAKRITDISGASDVFAGGVVAYSDAAKINLLGVSAETLEKFTAVSEQTAREMALGAKQKFGSDFAVATTGYSGEVLGENGTFDKERSGLVYVALATPNDVEVLELHLGTDRERHRTLAAHHAFNMLIRAV